MRRAILYIGGTVIVLAALVTTFKVRTTLNKIPPCPKCGARPVPAVESRQVIWYECYDCGHQFTGPARLDLGPWFARWLPE